MAQTEPLTGTPEQVKAQLKREFPSWSFIVSSKGRWWASRSTLLNSETLGADACDADNPDELRAQLVAKTPRGVGR